MTPFFMSVVSDSDHWMFISSTGGLTAGRVNAESALFPYDTDDKVTESIQNAGPLSIFLVSKSGRTSLWEPFSDRYAGIYKIERKIYMNISGDKLVFEENNLDLGLVYRHSWRSSDRFGFILTSWLHNYHGAPANARLLSGVQNISPYGAHNAFAIHFQQLAERLQAQRIGNGKRPWHL